MSEKARDRRASDGEEQEIGDCVMEKSERQTNDGEERETGK